MSSPTEDFSAISPIANDQSSAVLHELRVLSERPAPPQSEAGEHQQAEENKLGFIPNALLDLGIAAGAIWGAEAIGAVVFRSPKLAAMALETAAGSAKLGLAAAETAAASTKFAFLTGEAAQITGKLGIWTGTYGAGIAVRHYSYEALTGHKESWMDSANQVGIGVISLTAGRQLMKWSDKVRPTT